MNANHSNNYSYLDEIRVNEGAEQCKSALNTLFQKDTRRAITLLNDHKLMFPCLYILREPIMQSRIQKHLNARNNTALQIANQVKGVSSSPKTNSLSSKQNSVYPVLKWILETGSAEEIHEDDYEQILDTTVSVLMNIYQDIDRLPLVVDLIFKRNKSEEHIHDLVWALFRLHDPKVLRLISERLGSSDPKDVQLASELLNLDKMDFSGLKGENQKPNESYLHWLEENQPYLYFTEESFQYTSKPVFCTLDLERKYLQKGIVSCDKQPISSFDEDEKKSIEAFRQLNASEQTLLSEHSQKSFSKSPSQWKEWLQAPITEQIQAAKAGREGNK